MTQTAEWREVESKVYAAGNWLFLIMGSVFLLGGTIAFFTVAANKVQGNMPHWVPKLLWSAFAFMGGLSLAFAIARLVSRADIRRAAPDTLPEVPTEPVALEGSVVHARVLYELVEEADACQYRPARRHWRDDRIVLLGFGVPFLTLFAGLLSWVFHDQMNFGGWVVAILGAVVLTLLCGGSVLLLVYYIMRSAYPRLCRIRIPYDGGDVELDMPVDLECGRHKLTQEWNWVFRGEVGRRQLKISREQVAAVQLCPWKYTFAGADGRTTTWAVQGLLVLQREAESGYARIPILLSSDFVRAARLMQQLADTLDVPYLFHADAAGWKTEGKRAGQRPPLKIGGMQG